MSNIKLIKADVLVEPIGEREHFCDHDGDNCTYLRTHRVSIDFRANGTGQYVGGEYCETCATEIANRIKESLPDEETP